MTVVDASILADALVDGGPRGTLARRALRTAPWLAAPDLVDAETASALRRLWMAGRLPDRAFGQAIDELAELAIERHAGLPRLRRTFELRGNVTPYDAAYVALAEALGCELVTSDAKLAAAPGPRCPIRLLAG